MNQEERRKRIAELEKAQMAEDSWGAAVGAREEELKSLRSDLKPDTTGRTYYFTFGGSSPLRLFYVEITAQKPESAQSRCREAMRSIFGIKWSMCYDSDLFEGQVAEYHLSRLVLIEENSRGNMIGTAQ